MMAEYIEREALMEGLVYNNPVYIAAKCAPAADVAPVVHGRWDSSGRYKFTDGSIAVRCTKCGCSLHEKEYMENVWNYCPVCGAKMDLEV